MMAGAETVAGRARAGGGGPRPPAQVVVALAATFVRRGLRENGRDPADARGAGLEAICATVLGNVAAKVPEVVRCLDEDAEVSDRMRKLEDLVVVLAEAVLENVAGPGAMGPRVEEANSEAAPTRHKPPAARPATRPKSARAAATSRPQRTRGSQRNAARASSGSARGSRGTATAVRSSKPRRKPMAAGSASASSSSSTSRAAASRPRSSARVGKPRKMRKARHTDKGGPRPSNERHTRQSKNAAVEAGDPAVETCELDVVENCSVKIVLLARRGFATLHAKLGKQAPRELGALRSALLHASDRSVGTPTVVDEAKVLLFAYMCTRALCMVYDRIVEEHNGLRGDDIDEEANQAACLQLGCDLLNRAVHKSNALRSVILETVALLFGRDALDEVDREAIWLALEPFARPIADALMQHVGLTLTPEASAAWGAVASEDVQHFVFDFSCFEQLSHGAQSPSLDERGASEQRSVAEDALRENTAIVDDGSCRGGSFVDRRGHHDEEDEDGDECYDDDGNNGLDGGDMSAWSRSKYTPEDATQGGVDLGTGHERICVPQEEWRRLLLKSELNNVPERGLEHQQDHGSHGGNGGHHICPREHEGDHEHEMELHAGVVVGIGDLQHERVSASTASDSSSQPRRPWSAEEEESETTSIPAASPALQNHQKPWYSNGAVRDFLSDAQVLDGDEDLD